MSSLADRLRGIVRPGRSGAGTDGQDARPGPDGVSRWPGPGHLRPASGGAAVESLGGEWRDAGGQRYLVVDRSYAPGHRHGSSSVADGLPPEEGWPRLSLLGGSRGGGPVLFVDLETTGLAGGAGTYAFLVGCGWFERGRFRIRQFFLSSFAAERALLEAVRDVTAGAATVVTYNGKTFDLPLIETRFALNRMETPFASMPHVDLLHPARRLWRREEGIRRDDGSLQRLPETGAPGAASGCRLTTLEQGLLGHEREGDVPGFEIPARYFHYVHSGDAGPLAPVFEHNRLDLLSLALLTARAAQLLDTGAAGAATSREALGLGRLFEHGGMYEEALACFARAADMASTPAADVLRAFALLLRRLRRYDEAAVVWQRLLDSSHCPSLAAREAVDALAVHHEHRLRNLTSARRLALRSLQMEAGSSRRHASEHRLARLNRKLSRAGEGAPLF